MPKLLNFAMICAVKNCPKKWTIQARPELDTAQPSACYRMLSKACRDIGRNFPVLQPD